MSMRKLQLLIRLAISLAFTSVLLSNSEADIQISKRVSIDLVKTLHDEVIFLLTTLL